MDAPVPVPFRDLPDQLQFAKYDVLELDVLAHSDWRPESNGPVVDSLRRIGHLDTTMRGGRRRYVEPMRRLDVHRARRAEHDHTSLGALRPQEVVDLMLTPEVGEWTDEQLSSLAQTNLFAQDRCFERCRGDFATDIAAAEPARGTNRASSTGRSSPRTSTRGGRGARRRPPTRCGTGGSVSCVARAETRSSSWAIEREAPAGFLVLGVFWPPKHRPLQQVEHLDLGI